jgi:hypothetical protein
MQRLQEALSTFHALCLGLIFSALLIVKLNLTPIVFTLSGVEVDLGSVDGVPVNRDNVPVIVNTSKTIDRRPVFNPTGVNSERVVP